MSVKAALVLGVSRISGVTELYLSCSLLRSPVHCELVNVSPTWREIDLNKRACTANTAYYQLYDPPTALLLTRCLCADCLLTAY